MTKGAKRGECNFSDHIQLALLLLLVSSSLRSLSVKTRGRLRDLLMTSLHISWPLRPLCFPSALPKDMDTFGRAFGALASAPQLKLCNPMWDVKATSWILSLTSLGSWLGSFVLSSWPDTYPTPRQASHLANRFPHATLAPSTKAVHRFDVDQSIATQVVGPSHRNQQVD